jgi:hypothetical protein
MYEFANVLYVYMRVHTYICMLVSCFCLKVWTALLARLRKVLQRRLKYIRILSELPILLPDCCGSPHQTKALNQKVCSARHSQRVLCRLP